MEKVKSELEAVITRANKLRKLINDPQSDCHLLTSEGLCDSLMLVYNECNTDATLKRNKIVTDFVEKAQPAVAKLKSLRVSLTDFDVCKVIGRGYFGEVCVVREKQTGNVYAMKTMRKSDTVVNKNMMFFKEERDILAQNSSPWLVKLQYAFQDARALYLVMEYMHGGDLLGLLEKHNYLEESMAKFYLAEIVLAMDALHSLGYIHRDIKPDNILLDWGGHIKLADFGSSAKLDENGKTSSDLPAGTPDYIAPELLHGVGKNDRYYGVECDYWSFGVVAYELMFGHLPFSDEKPALTYRNIMDHKNYLKYSENIEISDAAKCLISNLLCEHHCRLDHDGVIKHRFFSTINWHTMKDTSPPYIPIVSSEDDTSNFEVLEPDEHLITHNQFTDVKGLAKELPFVGYSFVRLPEQKQAVSNGHQEHEKEENGISSSKGEIYDQKRSLFLEMKLREKELSAKKRREELNVLIKEGNNFSEKMKGVTKELEASKAQVANLESQLSQERKYRKDSESEAVMLIKSIKASWKKQKEEEIEVIVSEKQKAEDEVATLSSENKELKAAAEEKDSLRSRLESKITSLEEEVKELNEWKKEAIKHKRKSMGTVTLELNHLSKQLDNEKEKNVQLQQNLQAKEVEMRNLGSQIQELTMECKKVSDVEKLKSEIATLHSKLSDQEDLLMKRKNELLEKEDVISESRRALKTMGKSLERQTEIAAVLTQKVQELEEEKKVCSSSFEKTQITFIEKESNLEEEIKRLTSSLEQIKAEKMKVDEDNTKLQQIHETCRQKLREIEKAFGEIVETKKQQECDIETLEKQNEHLQEKLKHVQNRDESKTVDLDLKQKIICLETQLEKLNEKYEDVKDQYVLEKQKVKDLEMDVIKKDKVISDHAIDRRIYEREMKESKKEVEKAKTDANAANEKLKNMEKDKYELQKEMKEKVSQVDYLRQQLDETNLDLEHLAEKTTEKTVQLKEAIKKHEDVAAEKDALVLKTQAVETRLQELMSKETQHTDKMQQLKKHEEKWAEERLQLQNGLAEKQRQINDLTKNVGDLKHCVMFQEDNQVECEKALAQQENLIKKLKQQMEEIHGTHNSSEEQMKKKVLEACARANEQESLKIYAEKKLEECKKKLKNTDSDLKEHTEESEAELQHVYKQLASAKNEVGRLMEESTTLAKEKVTLVEQLVSSESHLNKLRRELTEHITEKAEMHKQLQEKQQHGCDLMKSLTETVTKAENYKTEMVRLSNLIEGNRKGHEEQEMRLRQTMQQQRKLIEHLQEKEYADKKKKTFGEKLFGKNAEKVQLSPTLGSPHSTTQYRRQLDAERMSNECLRQQIETEKMKNESLKQQIEDYKRDISVFRKGGGHPSGGTMTQKEVESLVQSPTRKTPAKGRIKHNIPHKFQEHIVMKGVVCGGCLDTVHFGRRGLKCHACGMVTHLQCGEKLNMEAPLCGLSDKLVSHYQELSQNSKAHSERIFTDSISEGKIKVLNKRNQWDPRWLKLSGDTLHIYANQASSVDGVPLQRIPLRPLQGHTRVIQAVARPELPSVLSTDLPFIFKVEEIREVDMPAATMLYLMAYSFPDKQNWVFTLEDVAGPVPSLSVIPHQQHIKPLATFHEEPQWKDIHCAMALSHKLILLGTRQGLLSVQVGRNRIQPTSHVAGVTGVSQMATVPDIGLVMMIAGQDKELVMTDLRLLTCAAEASSHVNPAIEVVPVEGVSNCHLFSVGMLNGTAYLAAAESKRIRFFQWETVDRCWTSLKQMNTSEPCKVIQFKMNCFLVATDHPLKIQLHDFSVEDILNTKDTNLAYFTRALPRHHGYPIAIIPISNDELLICYHEGGVFVSISSGQRTRSIDLKWSRLPNSLTYSEPFLFVQYFDSVEVCRITSSTCRKESSNLRGVTLKFGKPLLLGSVGEGAVLVATGYDDRAELVHLRGELLARADSFSTLDSISINTDSLFTSTETLNKHDEESMTSSTGDLTLLISEISPRVSPRKIQVEKS